MLHQSLLNQVKNHKWLKGFTIYSLRMVQQVLKGENIFLRLLEYEDLPYRVEWLNDDEISSGITIEGPVSLAKTQEWFRKNVLDDTKRHLVIVDNKTKEPIGILGFIEIDFKNRKAELYIAIGNKMYWGRNLGSEALQLALEYSFIELDLNRIYLYTDIGNFKAQRLYEKNGFFKEGIFRQHKYHGGRLKDYVTFSILKTEWNKMRKKANGKNINILITSVGRRTCLAEYFKKELRGIGNLVATDCSNLAPALYNADKYYIVPRIDHPNYISVIKDICNQEDITAVFSLIDPELSLLAKYSDEFRKIGVVPIVSSYDACELWLDKYESFIFCRNNGFKFAETYKDFADFQNALGKKEIDFPVIIKPQKGSASLNVSKVKNIEEAKIIYESSKDMIIQEFLNGHELGVDVYVDLISKKVVSIFVKEKAAMRAGETDKAKSIKSETLFKIIEDLVSKADLVGPIDIDVFDVNGDYYISEINPRFGGGYLLAYECGCNFPRYIINNLKGVTNKAEIGEYEENVYIMKHDTITIKRDL